MGFFCDGGRLGFITGSRFFRTAYGEAARRWLREGRWLREVDDFLDAQVFPGRTTYTAIVVLERGSPAVRYRAFPTAAAARADRPSIDRRIATGTLEDSVWSFDDPDLARVHRSLARRHGTLGDGRGLTISVGLQTLWGTLYRIEPLRVGATTVRGRNGLGEEVTLERRALRPLCRNRGFFPLRRELADAWVLFPYEVEDGVVREIRWRELGERFPRAAAYLAARREALVAAVETEEGADRWHLYTRPQNLAAQARPKVLFPMTIEDTVAAVDERGDVYTDNVNVNALHVPGPAGRLVAIAAIFCSTTFSALARLRAGLNDGGWRKLNRQYASLAPFPWGRLTDGAAAELAALARRIQALQDELLAGPDAAAAATRAALGSLWRALDEAVDRLYDLRSAERRVLGRHPRRVDRVELVLRGRRAPVAWASTDER